MSERDVVIGFDLGATKMRAVALDRKFQPLGKKKRKTKAHLSESEGLERMEETVRDALDDADCSSGDLSAIGFGIPGPVDLEKGALPEAPNMGWKSLPLRDYFSERFGVDVTVLNDVDAGLFGEVRFGAARGARCALGIFPGTGIGGACVMEDRIVRGGRFSCFEIGHMKVMPGGPLCGCGARGCLESVASRLVISAQAAAAAHRGDAPWLAEEVGTDLAQIRSGALSRSIQNGDTAVEAIVRDAARHIGRAAGNVINLIAPDVVVLGGGLVEAIPEIFREEIEETARRNCMPAFRDSFEVNVAELGDDAAVMGAAAWAWERE
ncbi:ROK family protein [Kiritimatiella glycovorans]|uniref:Putative transcriptional regulator n=1 Tax=Kiritimatiella glycovorans TaxID=1307763 RepID=A0A0G3EDT9_9BACT|nr:ROK family protein [Kiritimatiella glycovorans]AKJ63577.1 putative transcriptional regulator [Kiritimatiella glycovorans]